MNNDTNLNNPRIKIAQSLNNLDLKRLFSNDICVLKIPNFCSKNVCGVLSQWLLSSEETKPCYNEIREKDTVKYIDFGVDSNTICFNTTYFMEPESSSFKKYYDASLNNIRIPRQVVKPDITPMDKFRLELDEIWPAGAMIASFNGIKNTVGLFRAVSAERSALLTTPHIDSLPQHYEDLASQYTANIYFKVPDNGGELEILDIEPLTTQDIDSSNAIFQSDSSLSNTIKIKPLEGDLVMFNARKPHSVNSFISGVRTSVQCFVGITRKGNILMWS